MLPCITIMWIKEISLCVNKGLNYKENTRNDNVTMKQLKLSSDYWGTP